LFRLPSYEEAKPMNAESNKAPDGPSPETEAATTETKAPSIEVEAVSPEPKVASSKTKAPKPPKRAAVSKTPTERAQASPTPRPSKEPEVIPMAKETPSLSGLTDDEAKQFHGIFVSSFLAFTAIAVVAHILVWMWRPWL
jgi:light-harvesting complex 1 beta chain